MKLKIFDGFDGDCVLLESADGKRILCDGGRSTSMRQNVRDELAKLRTAKQKLDVVYVSHVDQDHITGVLALLQDELDWRIHDHRVKNGITKNPPKAPRPPEIKTVWHNAFRDQVDKNKVTQIESLLAAAVPTLNGTGVRKLEQAALELGDLGLAVSDALKVSQLIGPDLLNIPVNKLPGQGGEPKLLMQRKNQPAFKLGSLSITIVGPGNEELKNLAKGWNTWLKANSATVKEIRAQKKKRVEEFSNGTLNGEVFDLRDWNGIPDFKGVTTPNIASLMLMVEEPGKKAGTLKRVLLTGDGQQDFILEGLEETGFTPKGGTIHLDVLKVQHHGSENNLDAKFCRRVSADNYVFCGNGAHGNPETTVIQHIFDSRLGAKAQLAKDPKAAGRPFTFWFSTAAAAQEPGSEEHIKFTAVEKLVAKLEKAAKGKLKVKYNSGSFTTLNV
jgi:beta-lactamase superfamily II metal-dependent hydrolase